MSLTNISIILGILLAVISIGTAFYKFWDYKYNKYHSINACITSFGPLGEDVIGAEIIFINKGTLPCTITRVFLHPRKVGWNSFPDPFYIEANAYPSYLVNPKETVIAKQFQFNFPSSLDKNGQCKFPECPHQDRWKISHFHPKIGDQFQFYLLFEVTDSNGKSYKIEKTDIPISKITIGRSSSPNLKDPIILLKKNLNIYPNSIQEFPMPKNVVR